jgi:cytochrome c biogenesis protein CcmG/thiol:disulfide interchange protein DsbE
VTTSSTRPGSGRPDRRIAGLVGIAAVTTLAVVGIVVATRPGAATPDTIANGQPVPAIAGTALDGSQIDLAAYRGRPVVINFWGPSCPPCVTELPLLATKAKAHAADGIAILGVLTDDPVDGAQAFATAHEASWPTVVDPGGALKKAYHVLGRPQSFFVDRAGILRSIAIGPLNDADFEARFAAIAGGS